MISNGLVDDGNEVTARVVLFMVASSITFSLNVVYYSSDIGSESHQVLLMTRCQR